MSQPQNKNTSVLLKEIEVLRKQVDSLKNKEHNFLGIYHEILAKEKIAVFKWSLEENNISWSEHAEITFGLPAKTFGTTKENLLLNIHADDSQNFINQLSECFSSQSAHYETTFRLSENISPKIWLKTSCQIIYDQTGKPLELYGIIKDITELKRTNEEIKEQSDFLSLLLNHIPNQIFWKDKNLNYLGSNSNFAKTAGFSSPKELIGLSDFDLNRDAQHAKKYREEDSKILNEEKVQITTEELFHNSKGEEGWVKTIKIPLKKYNKIIGVLGISTDITKRKLIEKEQQRINQKYKSLFNNSPVPLWEEEFSELFQYLTELKSEGVTDFDKYFSDHPEALALCSEKVKVTDVNKATLKLHAANSKEELLGNLDKIFTLRSYEVFKNEIVALANGKKEFEAEGEIKTLKGDAKKISLTLSVDYSIHERAKAILATIDITDRKKAEEKILKSNKEYEILTEEYKNQNEELIKAIETAERSDRLKSEFLQNLSHEIRTPMNAIIGFTEFLELKTFTPAKRKQYINIIKNSGFQLLRIIDDILEISALETKHVQLIESDFNLNNLLTELFTIFQPQAKKQNLSLYLHKDLNDDNCLIRSDELKLKKVLMNLLENSLKYTNSGFIELGYHVNENQLELYVEDTGIGIDSARHAHIFERFSQAEGEVGKKQGGLGLGLSIVKENVKLLKGEIKLVSKINEGSKFIIQLSNCLVYNECNNEESSQKSKTCNILIVEDEEMNYFYFKSLMEEIAPECNLEHAKNGIEAVELCKRNDYELVFMDIKMPEMNGYEATIEIKKFKPNQNIIAQTAYSTDDDKVKAHVAGCNDFLSKPISMKTVQELLKKYSIL
jgi:PAS domain S-box-containing protein